MNKNKSYNNKYYSLLYLKSIQGQYCEVETNECAPKPCKNDGVCNDVVAGFTCTCKSGYVGLTCSETVCLLECILFKRKQTSCES